MTYHAGINVSLVTRGICIVDGFGAVLRKLKAESEPEALAAALTATGLEFARVGLEAGPTSQWLHAGLKAAGLPVVLLETRRLRAATKAMPVKTDRTDARVIAQMVRHKQVSAEDASRMLPRHPPAHYAFTANAGGNP